MDRLRLIEVVNKQANGQPATRMVETIFGRGTEPKKKEIYTGRTRSNKLVPFTPPETAGDLIGKEFKVKIKRINLHFARRTD